MKRLEKDLYGRKFDFVCSPTKPIVGTVRDKITRVRFPESSSEASDLPTTR